VTDVVQESHPEFKQTLEAAASAAGHEIRNALNGLVVNLEVVRSMAQSAGFVAEPFMTQAIHQSEESVRLAEAAVAILKLITGAIGPDGRVVLTSVDTRQVGIDGGAGAERVFAALQPLSERGVLSIERSGSTVILRLPDDSTKDDSHK